MSQTVDLIYKDGATISVKLDSADAKAFGIVTKCLEDTDQEKDKELVVNLGNISDKSMKLCLDYAKHYKGNLPKMVELKAKRIIEDTYQLALVSKLDFESLCELSMTANYLECPTLVYICLKQLATHVRDKTDQDMLNYLGRNVAFTKEEIEEAKKHPAYVIDPYGQKN